MKTTFAALLAVGMLASVAAALFPTFLDRGGPGVAASVDAQDERPPASEPELPEGYRDWKLISVAREEGSLDDIRAILGNDLAIAAYREAAPEFPDGAIIARLAWSYDASPENDEVFGWPQSFVAGPPKNGVQLMVKDSQKYAETGGWDFQHFDDGKLASEKVHASCFSCHDTPHARDFVFTRYAR